MRILVCGASGLIGSTMLRVLSRKKEWKVYGTLRSDGVTSYYPQSVAERLLTGVELTDPDALMSLVCQIKPDVVINCAGLTKHLPGSDDPLKILPVNTILPHRLAHLCTLSGARLIHVSTDCIFSGTGGNYSEGDVPDASDIYGRSKAMGEVGGPNVVTLRTSTIGHELKTTYGLLEWFLAQQGQCKGYRRAIFSGVPTVVFATIIRDQVIPRTDLNGVYQIAAAPINKYDLLQLLAEAYVRSITIIPDDDFVIDRSLNAARFREATGYAVPDWRELIRIMYEDHITTQQGLG